MEDILYGTGGKRYRIVRWAGPAPRGAQLQPLDFRSGFAFFLKLVKSPFNRGVLFKWLRRATSSADKKRMAPVVLATLAAHFLCRRKRVRIYLLASSRTAPSTGTAQSRKPDPRVAGKSPASKAKKVKVRIRFQKCGGEKMALRITPAPYQAYEVGESTPFKSGNTKTGDVEFEMYPTQIVRLHIFSTDYHVAFRTGDTLPPIDDPRGSERRMDVLGYMTGYLSEAYPSADPTRESGGYLRERMQKALLNFQVDRRGRSSTDQYVSAFPFLDKAIGSP